MTFTPKKVSKHLLASLRGTSPNERVLHRLHSVVLVLKGFSCSDAARLYGNSERIVAYWLKRFEEHGINGLREGARSGRPSTLTPKQLRAVQSFVRAAQSKNEDATGPSLAAFLKSTFKVSLTKRQCRRILNQISF
ncbi:MAG: helix-turn-helix domain-containing protein [Patescibacteria group bacterium]